MAKHIKRATVALLLTLALAGGAQVQHQWEQPNQAQQTRRALRVNDPVGGGGGGGGSTPSDTATPTPVPPTPTP